MTTILFSVVILVLSIVSIVSIVSGLYMKRKLSVEKFTNTYKRIALFCTQDSDTNLLNEEIFAKLSNIVGGGSIAYTTIDINRSDVTNVDGLVLPYRGEGGHALPSNTFDAVVLSHCPKKLNGIYDQCHLINSIRYDGKLILHYKVHELGNRDYLLYAKTENLDNMFDTQLHDALSPDEVVFVRPPGLQPVRGNISDVVRQLPQLNMFEIYRKKNDPILCPSMEGHYKPIITVLLRDVTLGESFSEAFGEIKRALRPYLIHGGIVSWANEIIANMQYDAIVDSKGSADYVQLKKGGYFLTTQTLNDPSMNLIVDEPFKIYQKTP